ncbi:MAG: cobalamin biosynthesis protein CobQ [Oscillospiraceae bacterium]
MNKSAIITIICGHYGSGKTNLTLNLALEAAERGEKVTVVDMDIVNPYFRSSEYRETLEKQNIELIAPNYAGSTMDTPSIPAAFYSVFSMKEKKVFIDVGGDDAGATILGRFSEEIIKQPYEMIYVINQYRVLSTEPQEAVALLKEIETVSRLKATALVNNSHLGVDTTEETVKKSIPFAKSVAKLTGLPLLYTTIPSFAQGISKDYKVVKRLVLFPWELPENQ